MEHLFTLEMGGELCQRIDTCMGLKVTLKMRGLATSYAIFAGNSRELQSRIEYGEDPKQHGKLWNADHRQVMTAFQDEPMRCLHNLVASAVTLIDHSRVVKDELYSGKDFALEYQSKVDEMFKSSPLAAFVRKMRNWMLHCGLLPLGMQLTFPSGSSICSVVLDVAELKAWDGWDASSKQYLAPLTDKIALGELVISYTELVQQFYRWLEARMHLTHHEEFEEWRSLERQLEEWQNWHSNHERLGRSAG